jgi:uncharacterized membrane protein
MTEIAGGIVLGFIAIVIFIAVADGLLEFLRRY